MAYYKRFLFIFLILFLLLFNFSFCFADEGWEEVETTSVTGIAANTSSNFFYETSTGPGVLYFAIEKGYIYKVSVINNMQGPRYVVGTSSVPALNVPYTILTSDLQYSGDSYQFISNGVDYAFISLSPSANSTYVKIERRQVDNIDSAIGNLVDNVGPNALWGVFGSGIDFIYVVVLVAFGIFIIVKVIKGISKGKSKI